ncbi:YbfB/YjiJ family MFS transporter [Tranquillimonas rosea]|uniref:YbfB/YjiJ family MFS transporter n=1 Tax=Tranquillimonas rosea TaxID=641238 RepID=UPI003BA9B3D8
MSARNHSPAPFVPTLLASSAAPCPARIKTAAIASERRTIITYFWSLSSAGFAATAISYGPARMGFGLFVPEFRSAFEISTSTVGFISSLGFFGFFLGLLVAQTLLRRLGPELPVLSGLIAAVLGMATVAAAPNLTFLALGVFLATSSAGFAWTPFNDAVHRSVEDENRPASLSAVSSGTGIGIAGAGVAALATVFTGLSWRVCWSIFAIAAALVLIGNWAALRSIGKDTEGTWSRGWSDLLPVAAIPLYAVAFAYGTNSAIYIAFAGDQMAEAGGVPGLPAAATPPLVFIFYGLFGLAALGTGRVKAMVGLPMLLRLIMLAGTASCVLVVILPASWVGLILSAGLQGLHVMMTSAILAFWSDRLFPTLPSLSFTAALLATATGSVIGPALAGLASDAFGAEAMFLGTAALPALTAAALLNRFVRERAVDG